MSRVYSLYLTDILTSIEKIKEYTLDTTFEQFLIDGRTIDAVVRNLEIIGEAVKSVPLEVLETQPSIEWKRIARFRDVIAHYYFKVDYEVVWSILEEDLDPLAQSVTVILEELAVQDKE